MKLWLIQNLRFFGEGEVIWQCPVKMAAQKPYPVILRVEKGRLDDFERGLDQTISRKKYDVDVATRTDAELSGEDFGIILQEANRRKVVGVDTYKEWI